jgi:hypothetical protein
MKKTPTTQKATNSSHVKDLLLLFAIPAGIALISAMAVYVPRLLADPKYDFIYAQCDNYSCTDSFSVDTSGHVAKQTDTAANQSFSGDRTSLHYYTAANDATRTITLKEAQQHTLNTSSKSPDNYRLVREQSHDGFLFWSDSGEGWYLKDGAKKRKIELATDGSYYSHNITFLGWVEK